MAGQREAVGVRHDGQSHRIVDQQGKVIIESLSEDGRLAVQTNGAGGGAGAGLHLGDGVALGLGNAAGRGPAPDAGLFWSLADSTPVASNALVLFLADANQVLHISDYSDRATNWNLSANTADPEVIIHSSTSPATDYLLLGAHDGTTALMTVAGGTAFNFSGANFHILNGDGLVVGHTAQISLDGEKAELQVLGTGAVDSRMMLGRWSASSGGPSIQFLKSRHAAIAQGNDTVVANNDELGVLQYFAADGTDVDTTVAKFVCEVDDASPAAGDIGAAFVWQVAAGGTVAISEGMRLTASGQLSLDELAVSNITVRGSGMFPGGIAFSDVLNAYIDDATHGSGTVAHYIGNQAITTSSDKRLKTDIMDWSGDSLALLRQGRLVEYAWDDPTERLADGSENPWGRNSRGKFVGFLAQETMGWAPWTVNAGDGRDCPLCNAGEPCEDHPYWFADYDHMVPLVVGGVQQLDARLTVVEADEWLKNQFSRLLEDDGEFRSWVQEKVAK